MPRQRSEPVENPKDTIGLTKLPMHLWPEAASMYGCLGLLDGALKYGRNNWRAAGIYYTVYIDAARRHLTAILEGEEVDPDSGLPHLSHALATMGIIADALMTGKLIDDRNFNGAGYRSLVEELTPHVARLQEKHADKNPKHYTIADN